MDPDHNLKEQLKLAQAILDLNGEDKSLMAWYSEQLAELVCALDGWLKNKNALPKRWNR